MNTSNASNTGTRTIKDEVRHLGKRKRALTYEQMVEAIKAKHPKAQTSVKTVQWYASRLRKEGETVNVKDGRSEGRAEH